jgi:hypothetical protein
MSTQYRLVQSGKTASGGCSAGQGSLEPVAPRIYFLFLFINNKKEHGLRAHGSPGVREPTERFQGDLSTPYFSLALALILKSFPVIIFNQHK